MTTLTGTVERINFQNHESAWAAIILKTADGESHRCSGIMPGLRLGMSVSLSGETQMTKWGESLNASDFTEVAPSDKDGIEKYLASGLIPNIGPKIAHEIVATFGEATLQVLDHAPERLSEVYGIGKKRIASIIESVREQTQVRTIMIWLKRYDLSNSLAAKIYKAYGEDSIRILEENPYRLSDDIGGVGFRKADETASRLGIHPQSTFRILSGLKACLEDAAAEGHTCLDQDSLVRTTAEEYLHLDEGLVRETLSSVDENRIIAEDGRVFLPAYYWAERSIASCLSMLLGRKSREESMPDLEALSKETGVEYSSEQRGAIATALLSRVSVITGGPGTGKTVTTNAIIRALEKKGENVLLAAPTGRAAKRMNEVTSHDAKTIHRLLEYTHGEFLRGVDMPLDGDALIVDEASMIDAVLMRRLVEAIPPTMRLVIVGDVDQLPSVGAGAVLKDIIDSGVVPVTRLTQIYRQAQGSDIIMNAHAINSGQQPKTANAPGTDFWFFQADDRDKVAELIVDIVTRRAPLKFGCSPDQIQVLSPMKKEFDPIGSIQLNRRLQQELNPSGEVIAKRENCEYRMGDKVMQVKNDYDKGVFNGDIGTIVEKMDESDEDKTLLVVDFDGERVGYSRSDLQSLELAYACTIHKSQGSEYPVVVMPVHESQYIMLRRNLLYTGVTRAKKECILVGTRRALSIGVQTQDTSTRQTMLRQRLRQSV